MARLQIDMLPVGDADAFLIEVEADGPREVILIDGGRNWEDGERVLTQLDAYYGRRIDHLVLSHVDVEHAGALLHVVESLEPDQIGCAWVHDLRNHGVEPDRAVQIARRIAEDAESDAVRSVATHLADSVEANQRLLDVLRGRGIEVREAFADGEDRIGPFQVLGPTAEFFQECVRFYGEAREMHRVVERGISFRRRHTAGMGPAAADETLDAAIDDPETEKQASLVMLLQYEGERYLFTGDAGRRGFAACKALKAKASDLHLLKVPNHGSKHNLSSDLLDLFRPDLAYISAAGVGINPHPALIQALKDRAAVVYSTHRAGNIWHHRGEVPERKGFETKRPI